MKNLKTIWEKIEIPVIILIVILAGCLLVGAIVTFDTSKISDKVLSSQYVKSFKGFELWGFLVVITRNIIIWTAIHWFNNNFLLSAVLMIFIPRVISLPFTGKSAHMQAKQGLLKEEFLKLKIYYKGNEEDRELKNMYTQDSQRMAKKFGIIQTEAMGGVFLSVIPILLVSFAVSPFVFSIGHKVSELHSLWFDLSKPQWVMALLSVTMILFQSYLPLKNSVGPMAEQQKSIVFIMPLILLFVFFRQPAIIPMVWLVTYIIIVLQMLYYHRLKKYDKSEITSL